MASQKSSSTWYWSDSRKQRYFVDTNRNILVFEDGAECPVPRSLGAAQTRLEQPRNTPLQRQQLNTVSSQQSPQSPRYQPSPSRSPQRSTEMTPGLQRRQPNRSFGTGMGQSQQPALQLRSIQERTDKATGVTTRVGYGPNGEKVLLGTEGIQEPLNNSYQIQSNPERFFTPGRVFYTLWTEPSTSQDVTVVTPVKYGENGICRIRRFVVIGEGEDYCQAVPIKTYAGHGLPERDAVASAHGAVYMANKPPQTQISDAGLTNIALRIDPVNKGEVLDPLATINFGKVYTIEHSLKVREVGSIMNVADLERGVSQAGQQQVPPRISARRPGPPLSTGNQGLRAQSIRGRGNRATAQPCSTLAGRAAYSQNSRARDDQEDDEDEDDEEDDEEESEEESDGDNDPRNKRPRRVSFQLSSRGRGGYSGFQRSRGQSAYQYSQR